MRTDEIAQAVGIIGAVGEDLPGGQAPEQVAGRRHAVLLPRSQHEAYRQAERIDYCVNLGAEPASGSTESLSLNAPLFILAPAAWLRRAYHRCPSNRGTITSKCRRGLVTWN